jgi:phosphoribosylanthranilate isomerase
MIRVKICGITNLKDALAAVEYGADALGFVFAPSPREVTPEVVKAIVAELPPFVCKVGVFVNEELWAVQETMPYCRLDLAQLHGDESPDYCAALSPRVIKSFSPGNLPPLSELRHYPVTAYLLDRDKAQDAETAEEKRWQLAQEMAAFAPVILAGGLTPENVSRAIEVARPYAVDVASGVERSPGKKDHAKLRTFIEMAKRR